MVQIIQEAEDENRNLNSILEYMMLFIKKKNTLKYYNSYDINRETTIKMMIKNIT